MFDVVFDTRAAFLSQVRLQLVPIFELFRDERVAIGCALALLATALGFGAWFRLVHWQPWYRSISGAAKYIERLPRDAEAFFDDFESFRERMGSARRLTHAWTEFAETLIVPEASGPIRNTARPQQYFNLHAAIEAGLPLSFYQSLPNIFVGVGLLLTFVGLVSALHFSAQGVTSPNVAEAQHALEGLLKAATFKFLTSIAGVLASIVLSLAFRHLARRLQVAFDRLNSALEARLHFVTAEAIALDQQQELKRQSLQLERFNTDFAVELANALDQKLSTTLAASLTQAVQPVVMAVESLSGNFGTQNQDAIGKMIGEFQSSLKQSAGAEMQNVVTALSNIRETLDRTSAGMGENGAASGTRIEQAAEALETTVRSMVDGLAAASSRMETLIRQGRENARADAEATSSAIALALRGAGAAVGKDIAAAGGRLSEDVERVSERLDAAMSPIGETLSSLTETLHTLDGRFDAQINQFDGSIGRLQGLVGHLERAGEQLRGAGVPIAETAKRFEMAGNRVEEAGRVGRRGQKLIGVSGYAEFRPVVANLDEPSRAINRRIDLRFLMATPRQAEVERLQREVGGAR